MGLGADDYLTKPFSSDEVLGAVNARLARKVTLTQQYEQRLTELRDSLALSMPHELRTPLTGIYTMLTVLLENFDLLGSADIRDGLQSIYSSAQRLERLVMNYLIYAELELAMNDPARRQAAREQMIFSAHELIASTARSAAERVARVADLQINLAETHLAIGAEHLRKLVEEIIDNACKFSAPGTPIEIGGELSGRHYQLAITDHGRGLTPEQIAKIGAYMQFERRLREQQGSGLGLAIVQRLVEFYDGQSCFAQHLWLKHHGRDRVATSRNSEVNQSGFPSLQPEPRPLPQRITAGKKVSKCSTSTRFPSSL